MTHYYMCIQPLATVPPPHKPTRASQHFKGKFRKCSFLPTRHREQPPTTLKQFDYGVVLVSKKFSKSQGSRKGLEQPTDYNTILYSLGNCETYKLSRES